MFRLLTLRLLVPALFLVAMCVLAAEDATQAEVAVALRGHTEAVYAITFTADGKQVITGSFDKTLKVWDAATGKEIKTLGGPQGHQNLVLSLSLSPDGTLLASGGSDNSAKIWDFPSNQPLRSFALADAISAFTLSPDGTKIVGASQDGSVRIFNAADGKEISTLNSHKAAVTDVAYSANGQTLVSCGADKMLRFWNPGNGQPVAALGAHAGAVQAVAVNPNNNAVYTAGAEGTLKFWSLPPIASRPLAVPHEDAVTAISVSADGNLLISGSTDKTVRVSNLANGQQTQSLTGPETAVRSVAMAPNESLLAAGTEDHHLFIWNRSEGKLLSQVRVHNGPITGVAFNAASQQLLTAGGDGTLKLWAVPTGSDRVLTADGASVNAVAVSSDGKKIYAACADKTVRGWTPPQGSGHPPQGPDRRFTGHTASVQAVALSPHGELLASAGDDATVRVWNPGNGQQIELFGAHAGPVASLAFHPNGRQLLSASTDGSLKLWQLPGIAPKLYPHTDAVTCAVLSADGSRLVTGCADKVVRLWKLAEGQMERTFAGNTLAVLSVALSADGTQVAAGGADKSLILWTTTDAKEVKKFANLPAAVQAVAFSPDGKLLAAGLADSSLHVFDLTKGEETRVLSGHKGAVTAVVFTPRGDVLVSASVDKTIQLWNVADGSVKAKLEHGSAVQGLALTRDGTKLASGGVDKAIKLWSLREGKLAAIVNTPAEVRSLSFNADGTQLAVGSADNKVRVYDAQGHLREFFTHDAAVQAVTFHPDGQHVFSTSADKTARQWTTALVWQAHQAGPIHQAVFSPNGDRVITGGDDKRIKVWNAANGQELKEFAAHDGPITGVGINADGTRIVSAGADKTVKVWKLEAKPEDKPILFSLPSAASAVTISPNGQRLAVAFKEKDRNQIRVVDMTTGKELETLTGQAETVRSLAFLADNRTLVSADEGPSVLLSEVGVTAVFDAHSGGVAGVVFHPNGTLAVSGGADRMVKVWDLAAGKVTRSFGSLPEAVTAVALSRDGALIGAAAGKTVKVWTGEGKDVLTLTHPAAVSGLSFSADKTRLATSAADSWTRVWDLANGQEIQAFPHGGPVRGVAFHPTNNNLLVAGGADKTVYVHTITHSHLLVPGTPINSLAVMPNGSHVLAACADKTVKLYNTGNGNLERTFTGATSALQAVAVSKNGVLVAAASADNKVFLYNLADGKLLARLPIPGTVRSLAFSANNQTLAAACVERSVQTWNVAFNPGQPLPADFGKPMQTFRHAAVGVAFAPDSVSLYSAGNDKTIKLWKLASAGPVKNFGHPNLVDAVAFSPSGTQLATGCHDGKVRLFDVAKGQAIKEINAHPTPPPGSPQGTPPGSPVYCLAWSPDGMQLLSGSNDHSLKLWDVTSGSLVREFKGYDEKAAPKGHQDGVFCLAFSPDGKQIASGSSDRTIKIWNIADGTVALELTNPNLKPMPGQPPPAHPGRIYGVRYTPDGKYLISAGGAPRNTGYLAVWSATDGRFLWGEEKPLGNIFALALSNDGKQLAIGTSGASKPAGPVVESAFVLKIPVVVK
jgi:WD40 repeat protein